MRNLLSHVALVAASFGCAPLAAQQGAENVRCPDQVIQRVPPELTATNVVVCGTGVQIDIGGVSYTSPPGTCALFITYTPEHTTTRQQVGSNTYTEPAGAVRTYIGRYRCRQITFFFVFPWTSVCEEIAFAAADVIPTYAQYPCRD